MKIRRPLAVSLVAFDGHPIEVALSAVAGLGATHVEPAYISGTMAFTEDDLTPVRADALRRAIAAAGLGCVAVSLHADNGRPDAAERLIRRARFAAALGAGFAITNTARRDHRDSFLRAVTAAIPEAEREGVAFALENPGHGPDDLLRGAEDAPALLAAIGSDAVTLNYDCGNTLTNTEGALRPDDDLPRALPHAAHIHLKDMRDAGGRWEYVALGDGALDYDTILAALRAYPALPLCVELPLRQIRRAHMPPLRDEVVPPLGKIEVAVARSLRRMRDALGDETA